jgi:hypothetical protein
MGMLPEKGNVGDILGNSCLSGCFSSPQSVGVRLVKSTAKHTTRSVLLKQPDKHEATSPSTSVFSSRCSNEKLEMAVSIG